jgi:ATP-binding cassette subfamily F protein 3
VLITHDRHLIRAVADRIIEVEAGPVRSYEGDYELYLYRKGKEAPDPAARPAAVTTRPASDAKQRRRVSAMERASLKEHRDAVRRVERELERETAALRELEAQLADPAFYARGGDDVGEAVRRHGETRERISELEDEWERSAEALAQHETPGSA